MKTAIVVSPNRDRGYDATVYSVRKVRPSSLLRTLRANGGDPVNEEREALHTVNAPSEEKARTLAQAWIDAQPKQSRTRRAMSERAYEALCESEEASRNEERAYGRD